MTVFFSLSKHVKAGSRGVWGGAPVIKGWKMGLEPTTLGTTIRCSNQLSYVHHVEVFFLLRAAKVIIFLELRKLFLYLRNLC